MFNKLEQYLFYIFLFSIPFQTRKILYFDGWRFNEWQSVSVYATDILLVILLVFWAVNYLLTRKFSIKPKPSIFKNSDFYLFIFLVISAISIKNSGNYPISWFQWLKLIEFSIFYWYLSRYSFEKFGLFNSCLTLVLSGLFQAVIAIAQFLKQSSIGFRYLGESIINNEFSGVASFYLPDGAKIIRSYGTMPHPNVLASFLFLSIFSFYFIYLYSRLQSEHRPIAGWLDKFMLVSYGVILFAFFTTFSRVIIFIWFISFFDSFPNAEDFVL